MAKKITKTSQQLTKTIDNPWIISLVLASAGLALFILINTATSWPNILLANLNNQPTAEYTVQSNFQELAANEGNLTTKTAISPASLRGPIISPNDPSRGSDKAIINIVYFSDFACSFCRQQETIIKQALEQYPDQVRVIWKDLPEINPSSQSYQAAKAGRCAFQQNKFWLFHDQLLSLKSLQNRDLEQAASMSGLDMAAFRQCLNRDQTAEAMVDNNLKEADALGVSGTPYIYVNQRDFLGQISWEDLQNAIEAELAIQ
ncbi:MAG TPA: thioredoxin domain-containing protein [bacterium]|mgnify:FL=1|nr:thioredoxin domain-containing protein [bacterium]HOQ91978.1 thioredoxin domain-containing protein [bacterium]HPL22453.1 thioredoxin domain-containing protein [bacterium]